MFYDVLGYGVIGLHYAFLLYLVVGGFIAWRWPKTIVLHAMAAAWGVLIVAAHLDCPLTWAQNGLRELAGRPRLTDSFLNLYVQGTFYPHHAELATQGAVALVVLISWLGLWYRLHSRRAERTITSDDTRTAGRLPAQRASS